jgi:hypothetical protein
LEKAAPHWSEIAAAAERMLASADQGEKEKLLSRHAKSVGKNIQTLRAYLLAWRFVDTLDRSDRAKALGMPVASVEVIARWHAHDPGKAIEVLRGYDPAKNSVRTVRKEEASARSRHRGASGRQRASRFRDYVVEHIHNFETVWPARPLYRIQDASVLVKDDPENKAAPAKMKADPSGKADFVMRMDLHEKAPTIAVLIVGPYTSDYLYQGRAEDWCLRALGLSFFHSRVALVLPRGVAFEKFAAFLEKARDANERIQIVREAKAPDGPRRGGVLRSSRH